jgi:Protein of unknown function (DUF4012)
LTVDAKQWLKNKVDTKQETKGKERRIRRLSLVAVVIALFCILGSVFSIVEYPVFSAQYHKDMSLVQAGMQHLRTAANLLKALSQNPFDASTNQNAQREFANASTAFARLNNDLKSLPGISTSIPVYGARINAALHLAPAAIEISQAGLAGCDILNVLISRLRDPLNIKKVQGLKMADLASIDQNFHRVKAAFDLAIAQVNQVSPADLQFDPRLSKELATLQKQIPMLHVWLDEIDKLLPILPTLLGIGTPANYLIEVLDSTELRPGGGFIGNYGLASLSGGRLVAAHITDVELLDFPFRSAGHVIPLPPVYSWFQTVVHKWGLRDSGLDADFPTAAKYGEQNYLTEGGKVPVQGVIAITPMLIQHALAITGPIYVPEYNETVTAQNLIARIHFHQLAQNNKGDNLSSPDGHSSIRKRFTAFLAEHFLARVRKFSPSALATFVQLMINSLRTKDLQIYFNSTIAEHLLQLLHLDAAIQAPVSDSLFVVDANIGGNKANSFIINTLNDVVTIDNAGNALHHTTIHYAWTLPGRDYGSKLYEDYVRVYVPPGSILQMQDGWKSRGTTRVFGREVWAGYFTLKYGQTRTIALVWAVPGVAKNNATGWHYQYLIQKQAGTHWTLNLQVALRSCAVIIDKSGGLVSNGKATTKLVQALNEDMNVGIAYKC